MKEMSTIKFPNQTESYEIVDAAARQDIAGKSNIGHTHTRSEVTDFAHEHDERYYTETEIDTKLSAVNSSISNITNGSTTVAKAEEAEHATSANTATSATSATKATQDASGNVITSTYETKTDASSKLDEAKEYTDTVASGKANASHTHGISDITNLQTSLDGKVPTSRTVNGKALSSNITLSASDVGAAASSHSHSSYVNQNAFSNVKVGSTTVAADTITDTLEIAAGTGISVTGDATNDKVTITNSGVRSIATGGTNGTISVNTNGTSANVAVKGLGSAAYTASTAYDAAGTAQTKADAALESAKTYTDGKIDALVGEGASETLDTISEISAAIEEHQDVTDALNAAIGNKVDKVSGKGLSTNDYTTTEKNKLAGIASGAEVNQNAFSNVVVGSTTIAADGKTDTLTLVAGSNITLTPDATNDKITIAAKDTTYTLGSFGITASADELNYTDGVTSNIQTQLDSKAASSHTHKYAGSSSAGGAATSANKLNTDAGSATHPVYFANGIPVETTYTLSKSVPSDAKFTDTTYGNATTSANGLMSSADKTKLDYTNIAYGTCSTAAGTAAKVITVSGNTQWALTAGSRITIKFSATNTASNPTFNVNGTGAKSVWYNTAVITTSNLSYAGYANRPMDFVYDGTQFVFTGWSIDSNTTYSQASLGQGYGTCSTAEATVAKAVTLSSYSLAKGGIVSVKFTYAVPASATMNINSKGAKAIFYRGSAITAGVIKAGDIATFIYDGTQYHLITVDRDENTTYSAAGSSLGLVKSGGDVTISSGVITVNDDSHNHTIANVDNLQSSLDAKQATITGGASTITSSNLTASRALVSDSSGKVAASAVTSTELGYLDGVTSNIQTQLDSKVGSDHTHSDYASKSLYDTRTINVGRKSDTNVGSYSLAFGADTQASANYTQAFGINSVASGFGAHAEGTNYRENNSVLSSRTVTVGGEEYTVTGTTAQGRASHAEGVQTFALGYASHSEGYTTTAGGEASHAEGYNTIASGNWSHSEGEDTVASAIHSHAEGYGTIASSIQQHVQGKYNIEDANGDYLHIVGNGGSETSRSNAHTLDWDGNAWYAGNISLEHNKSILMKSLDKEYNVMTIGESGNLLIGQEYYDNEVDYSTSIGAGNQIQLRVPNETIILFHDGTDGYFRPTTNGKCYLGNSSFRWNKIYAATATVQTSDAREKENIVPFSAGSIMTLSLDENVEPTDMHSELFDRLQPVQYNMIDGNGKICYGLIAQDVASAMEELGYNENDLDLVYHEYYKDEETGEEKDIYGIAYANLIPMNIYEIQKLKSKVATSNTEIALLKEEIALLKEEIALLK